MFFPSLCVDSFFYPYERPTFQGREREKTYVKLGESVPNDTHEDDNKFFSERILMPDYVLASSIFVVH